MRDEDLRGRFRRDYTKEVINQTHQPKAAPAPKEASSHDSEFSLPLPQISETAEKRQPKTRRRINMKKLFLFLFILCLLIGGAYGGYRYWTSRVKIPIPASIRSSAEFPLLYPSK